MKPGRLSSGCVAPVRLTGSSFVENNLMYGCETEVKNLDAFKQKWVKRILIKKKMSSNRLPPPDLRDHRNDQSLEVDI